ncbi:ATP synthase mitochondrial F1 complex assembly factor 2 [Pseudolycoriella hygida]|uniref:ATP synthase mitochondrial F1 complex assembly factor 2 n=1 Tax=Pseudolycoriella hygida TaxID=35572 RepID=A0A9Q0NG88_9DIPT|nr:ATP synthase mitochondrial F1 complex assembly factor 2 [Pseudolycoriella hygida]
MFKRLLSSDLCKLIQTQKISTTTYRQYATAAKRFYKNTNVVYSGNNQYEITLDNRKLKTPNGAQFVVRSEPLAIAVAAEWNAQKETVERSTMHLTALCSTAIDNPNRLTKEDMVNFMLNFVPTDTVLFHSSEDDELYKVQCRDWDPVIKWFNDRYETDLKKSRDISSPVLAGESKMNISKYLMSYDLTSMHGFVFAVDVLKSIVLAFACIDRYLTVEQAVRLSRLEEEFQITHWGRVEWAHDLSQQDLQARLAAAVLFIHFNTSEHLVKEKLIL